MRYTKPSILATINANRAVQTGSDPQSGKNFIQMVDNGQAPLNRSTTGAYEADE
jgi:hypothetical protein